MQLRSTLLELSLMGALPLLYKTVSTQLAWRASKMSDEDIHEPTITCVDNDSSRTSDEDTFGALRRARCSAELGRRRSREYCDKKRSRCQSR